MVLEEVDTLGKIELERYWFAKCDWKIYAVVLVDTVRRMTEKLFMMNEEV